MRTAAWLLGLLLGSLTAAAETNDLELCARVGLARTVEGTSIALGDQRSPKYWGTVRDVRYQVCTRSGRPVTGRRRLELVIDGNDAPDTYKVAPAEVWTDEQGRFTATYGGGSLRAGLPWPPEKDGAAWHEFRYEGRTLGVFRVEQSSSDLNFFRPRAEAWAKWKAAKVEAVGGGTNP
jgi:hypothetical protein